MVCSARALSNGCKSRVSPNSGNYIAKSKVKAQKLQKQHALKGQKLLAQGIALGNVGKKQRRPVRAKALYTARYFKAFALTGRQVCVCNNPGRCPGLGASALYLSLRPVTVGSGRVGNFNRTGRYFFAIPKHNEQTLL